MASFGQKAFRRNACVELFGLCHTLPARIGSRHDATAGLQRFKVCGGWKEGVQSWGYERRLVSFFTHAPVGITLVDRRFAANRLANREKLPQRIVIALRGDDAGRLVMSVLMTSEKLASPIVCDLVYEKADP